MHLLVEIFAYQQAAVDAIIEKGNLTEEQKDELVTT